MAARIDGRAGAGIGFDVRVAVPCIVSGGRRCASGSPEWLNAASARGFANGITFGGGDSDALGILDGVRGSDRKAAGRASTDVLSASWVSR